MSAVFDCGKGKRAGIRVVIPVMLLAFGAALPAVGEPVSQFFGDDFNSSSIKDHAGLYYSCPWIDRSLMAFEETHASWKFTAATPDQRAFLADTLKVVSYYPWVVRQPTYSRGGSTWGGSGPDEMGGAYIELSYTPRPGDPVDIRWIQAVAAVYRGGGYDGGHLDNPGDRSSPFYDVGADDIAGPTYFVDIPYAREIEYEGDPVADVDFQVFLARDAGAGGGFDHNVLVYGGIWWGYTYRASDTIPEPATLPICSVVVVGFLLWRVRRARVSRVTR
jgi:hypothetical protein